ncbi:hypothetical protein AVEN_167617-1 [Araneus ventricosus]|uniref:Endonuclease/exonuclease/phosphatase domain-containing protein n=1 Tax=Araneus ventricosus TaxID=182803 RepID=A0A4Y2E650_ARAVE|nr:hypothetical protein AVEN_167617-1 [Araneus ventricosus]
MPNAIVRLIDSNIVTKYIIRDVETDFILEDIAKEIASQDIVVSKIVRFKKKGSSDPIPIILIDEIGKTNRSEIKIGRVIFRVTRFIENPKVCFKCLKFGHTQIRCNKDKRCSKCGGTHNDECTGLIKCFRCNEPHDALDKNCKIYIREQEIINLVRNQDISFAEARKRVTTGQSFAAVTGNNPTSKPVVLSGVQTQLSDLFLAIKSLQDQITNLAPQVSQISNLREGNKKILDRCIQTQEHLDHQIAENKNLQALIESQNKTIESLTNRLTVLESNYGFRASESPDPGLFHQSLDELNNFSSVIPVDTGPGIGGKFDTHWLDSLISHLTLPFLILGDFNVHHPALGSLFSSSDASKVLDWISINNMCVLNMSQFTRFQKGHAPSLLDLSADIINNISLEISHDTYDSDHFKKFWGSND